MVVTVENKLRVYSTKTATNILFLFFG